MSIPNYKAGDQFKFDHYWYTTIIEVPSIHGEISVYRYYDHENTTLVEDSKRYIVTVDGIVRHPACTSDDVVRALGTYLINFKKG